MTSFVGNDADPGWVKWSTGSEGGGSSAHSCPEGSQMASSDGSQGGVSPPGEESPSTAPPSRSGKGAPRSRKGASAGKHSKQGSAEPCLVDAAKEMKMRRVDWRWAAAKGFLDKDTNTWNEAMGGQEEYLRQRNKRMISRAKKAHDAKEARQVKEALRSQAIHSATNLYSEMARSRPPCYQHARRLEVGQSLHGFASIQQSYNNSHARSMDGMSGKSLSNMGSSGLPHGDFSSISAHSPLFNPVPMHGGSPLQFQHSFMMDGQMDDVPTHTHVSNFGGGMHPEHHGEGPMNHHSQRWHSHSMEGSMGGMGSAPSMHIWRPAASHATSMSGPSFHQSGGIFQRGQSDCSAPSPDRDYPHHKQDYPHHKTCSDMPHGMDAGALVQQQRLMQRDLQREQFRRQHEMQQHLQGLEHNFGGSGREYGSIVQMMKDEMQMMKEEDIVV
mmetsp:Transcript_8995/g.22506  ORF Transcript_8995/g.22506 Transcript_8995/m.22506 type:complete len:442 (-) Transcript_8995:235-1560(-)|eukprot:CAMPEP_0206235238 /NCGR_PEP_ID=MMETSP0047_2-20121206/13041_1 /ASSEMBLY_ACC=CAM_ASM_000192 /TAXON_ID=195065 /ORGANISM="Chroomonas mesostigmatica_cf, Strain CCMP1168" /LENGTH=441 /DNA_ID=CAMNT_0053659425 /DNA_START=64 /DNA_END=1389 /DNA_ORIENTATION=+